MTAIRTGTRRAALLAPTVLALVLSGPAYAGAVTTDAAPSQEVTVARVTANGSGCPGDTARAYIDPNNAGFRVVFDEYAAMVGRGTEPTARRRNCFLSVQMQVPSGYTYAISDAEYRGYAYLAAGATATQTTTYYVQGSSDTRYIQHTFTGPYNGRWVTRDAGALVWAPCDRQRNLNINTELRANLGSAAPSTTNFVSLAKWRHTIFARYHFTWRRC
jgi:hypothetical protein